MADGDRVDLLLANRIRAGVLAFLWDRGESDFTAIAETLGLANNTLSGHLSRLEDVGYVELRRGFLHRKPRTRVVLTGVGRAAWADFIETLR
jgi:DNA-binding MarR family transcriptional regulator